jgi:hypothetical protein
MRRTFLLLAWLLVPTAAIAQVRSETGGLRLNAHLVGNGISSEVTDRTETGAGLGVSIGYGFTPRFQLLARIDGAGVEPDGEPAYTLGNAELAVRYSFASSDQRLVPFIAAGPALRLLMWENVLGEDLTVSGLALNLGGGLAYFVSPSFALEGELTVGLGRFTRATWGDEVATIEAFNATTSRAAAGVSWYPRGRRTVVASVR